MLARASQLFLPTLRDAPADAARQTLGWEPRTPLREALTRTLDFYREHLPHYI